MLAYSRADSFPLVSKTDYAAVGLEKIVRDLAFLSECFREVLVELGETELAERLPWIARQELEISPAYPVRMGQAFSISFQLLNLVEENVAAQMRRMRETELGLAFEPGLWGYHFRRLKEIGLSEREIAEAIGSIRVEPVLTAHPTEAKRATVLEQLRALEAGMRIDVALVDAVPLGVDVAADLDRARALLGG